MKDAIHLGIKTPSALAPNIMEHNLLGLVHLYDPDQDVTSVSWAYRDTEDIDYFILEVYDEDRREWVPYDNHMGIIEKDQT